MQEFRGSLVRVESTFTKNIIINIWQLAVFTFFVKGRVYNHYLIYYEIVLNILIVYELNIKYMGTSLWFRDSTLHSHLLSTYLTTFDSYLFTLIREWVFVWISNHQMSDLNLSIQCDLTPAFSDMLWFPTRISGPKIFLLHSLLKKPWVFRNLSLPTSDTVLRTQCY